MSGRTGVTRVVTLCGSMRFFEQMLGVAADLTTQGYVVLAPFPVDESTAAERVSELAVLHRRKIDMADSVIVVTDESGHIGDATQGEIAYARSVGKLVSLRAVTASGDQIGTTIPWPPHWPAPAGSFPPGLIRRWCGRSPVSARPASTIRGSWFRWPWMPSRSLSHGISGALRTAWSWGRATPR